jgi:hypothetical protein
MDTKCGESELDQLYAHLSCVPVAPVASSQGVGELRFDEGGIAANFVAEVAFKGNPASVLVRQVWLKAHEPDKRLGFLEFKCLQPVFGLSRDPSLRKGAFDLVWSPLTSGPRVLHDRIGVDQFVY